MASPPSSSPISATASPPTAADAIVDELVAARVSAVFLLPGEENIDFVAALAESDIDCVVCRHEQHAAFMAVAHARLTGSLGVCVATLGPGALNLFTGLAQAQLIGVPVLAITGQKAMRNNEEGSFQVIDVVGAVRPLITHATTLSDPARASVVTADAIQRAREAAGAVLLEIPEDVADQPAGATRAQHTLHNVPVASDHALRALRDRIEQADRPLVLAGVGTANAPMASALERLCEQTGLSVVTTQMGKGTLDEAHPRSLRSLGIHRDDHVHAAFDAADLVIAVGYQPVEHPPLAWNGDRQIPIVHVHERSARVEAGYRPELECVGDMFATLDRLGALQVETTWSNGLREQINAALDAELAALPSDELHVPNVVESIGEFVSPEHVVALDNGLYKIWFARRFPSQRPSSLVLDNALATMGAGLATGMEAARLGRPSIVVTGDGGLLMNVGDLETAHRLGLDLTIVVLRDDAYGFIGWHQHEQGRERNAVDLASPDLVALASAFGAHGDRVRSLDELERALRDAAARRGLAIVDCPISYDYTEVLEDPTTCNALPQATPAPRRY